MPQGPPRRRGDDLHVAGRAQEQAERRRGSPLIRVDARDVDDGAGAKPFQGFGRRPGLEGDREDALAAPQHQRPLRRRPQHAEEVRPHAHQRGVVIRRQDVRVVHRHGGRLWRLAGDAEDGVGENRFSRRHRREAGDVDDRARLGPERLLGLDARAAGAVVDVEDVPDVAELGGGGEVVDLDRMSRDVAGDHAADADPAVDFSGGRIVVDAAGGAGHQPERVWRRFEDADVVGPADEQRDAAQLFGASEQRPDVPAQPHPGVDEALEILRLEVPERGPHHPFADRHVHEERVQARDPTDARRAGPRR